MVSEVICAATKRKHGDGLGETRGRLLHLGGSSRELASARDLNREKHLGTGRTGKGHSRPQVQHMPRP